MLAVADVIQCRTVSDWRDFVAQTFLPLEVKVKGNAPFIHTALNDQIGDLTITELRTNSSTVTRTSALVSRADKAVYKASLQLSGYSEVVQNNKRAIIKAGQWAIYDTMQPYSVSVSDSSHFLVLQINHSLLSVGQQYLQAALARCLETNSGCGQVLFQLLSAAMSQRDSLSAIAAQGISNAILQLISAQISETFGPYPSVDPVSLHQAQLLKIQYYIEQQLHNSDLTVDHLCQVFKCSRRYLYNLFSSQSLTPADYIQRRRLESSCQYLADSNYKRPISELAYQHGFKDAATFSHAFRRRYGISPTAWRQKQLHIGALPS